jgi:hypothetical protein
MRGSGGRLLLRGGLRPTGLGRDLREGGSGSSVFGRASREIEIGGSRAKVWGRRIKRSVKELAPCLAESSVGVGEFLYP